MNQRSLLGFALLCSVFVFAVPSKTLVNKLDKSTTFTLKWKKRIGVTTFRSPILYHQNQVIIGSNGSKFDSVRDSFDGLYQLDSSTGKKVHHLISDQIGDRDVTGVALSRKAIYFGNDENQLVSISWNGTVNWAISLAGDIESTPALEDIDSDGIPDILVGDESGSFYAINGKTGAILWSFQAEYKPHFTYPESRSFFSSAALTDINKDGVKDCVIGNRNGDVYAFNSKTGDLFWEYRTKHPSGIYSSPTIRNGKIYIAETYSTLYVLSLNGKLIKSIIRKKGTPPDLFSSPIVDENETIAIGVSSKKGSNGVWFVFKDETQLFVPIGKVSATPLLADILGLGYKQFIVITENGKLVCFDSKGKIVGTFNLSKGSETTPLIADIDLDGYLEIVLATKDQFISCYDTTSRGPVAWGSFRGNPLNTGVFNDPISLPAPYKNNAALNRALFGVNYSSPIDINELGLEFFLISKEGIGPAKIGTTYGKMKLILGPHFTYKDIELTLGLRAKAVLLNDLPLFYVIYPAFKVFNDQSTITILGTDNSSFMTADGINAFSPVSELTDLYGPATFSYHAKNTLEEFVLFQKKPKWLWLANYGQEKIGTYKAEQAFNITQDYDENKPVKFIGVKK
jgi:outer membrane protein assembly factor BamB